MGAKKSSSAQPSDRIAGRLNIAEPVGQQGASGLLFADARAFGQIGGNERNGYFSHFLGYVQENVAFSCGGGSEQELPDEVIKLPPGHIGLNFTP